MKPHAFLVVTLALLCAPARAQQENPLRVPQADRDEYLQLYGLFAEAVTQVELNNVTPVDRERLFTAALRGMMAELDPYSTYLPPEQHAKIQRLSKKTPRGVGLELAIEKGRLVVLGARAGSPAEKAGLMPGERVLEIDGRGVETMSLAEADQLLVSGAPVSVRVRGLSGDTRTVELTPESSSSPTVVGKQMIAEGFGYLRVTAFGGDTASELRAAVAELREQGLRGLTLDLRFNSGGLLDSAIDVADLFLSKGVIVSVVSRRGDPRVFKAGKGDTLEGRPLVVLVNRYSASGSEVVAAALKDNGRATLVGEKTWGKGSVQSVIPLGKGKSALKLTTATYLRPNGKNIHRFAQTPSDGEWGVHPSDGFVVDLSEEEARTLLEAWKNPDAGLKSDRQLERAAEALAENAAP